MRYHIGHNVPGYLPESDVLCVEDIEEAIESLKDNVDEATDSHLGIHEGECVESEEDSEKDCPCVDYDAYTASLAVLSAIADGDVKAVLLRDNSVYRIVGRNMHWIEMHDDCQGCPEE